MTRAQARCPAGRERPTSQTIITPEGQKRSKMELLLIKWSISYLFFFQKKKRKASTTRWHVMPSDSASLSWETYQTQLLIPFMYNIHQRKWGRDGFTKSIPKASFARQFSPSPTITLKREALKDGTWVRMASTSKSPRQPQGNKTPQPHVNASLLMTSRKFTQRLCEMHVINLLSGFRNRKSFDNFRCTNSNLWWFGKFSH